MVSMTLTPFNESLHPRQSTGEFAHKRNSDPSGGLSLEPEYLRLSDETIAAYKIQHADVPGLWSPVDRNAFIDHLHLPADVSDETLQETVRLLRGAGIDRAAIDQVPLYETPGTTPQPLDVSDWGGAWTSSEAWVEDSGDGTRYVRGHQIVQLDPWPSTANLTTTLAAAAEDALRSDGVLEGGQDITVSVASDGVTFHIERTIDLPQDRFAPDVAHEALTSAAAPGEHRLRQWVDRVMKSGLIASNDQLAEADNANTDAVIAAHALGRDLSQSDQVALGRRLFAHVVATRDVGALYTDDWVVLRSLSRGYITDCSTVSTAFNRIEASLDHADGIPRLLAAAFRNG